MAKRRKKEASREKERLLHCSGPHWEGDGSKAKSTCPFKQSRVLAATRYQCHCCATKLGVNDILADHNGPTKAGLNTPLPPPSPPKKKRRKAQL